MFKINSLILYKNRPARLVRFGDRLEIELEDGEGLKVRLKDVVMLHPGPLMNFAELHTPSGLERSDIQTAWEILSGSTTTLPELAELAYGHFTPATAWATWQQVMDGLYFEGDPEHILARPAADVEQKQKEREKASLERNVWHEFLARVKQGKITPEDLHFFKDVEALALGRADRSQVMRALSRAETPDNAHALLLELGVWTIHANPYPARFGVDFGESHLPVGELPDEERLDLTHLPAFAIDDAGTDTPDDAVSLEGNRIWVHVADVAALVSPGSPLDMEARSRGLTLHLPEGAMHLLPWDITARLGLGLNEISPALSFGMDLDEKGEVTHFTVVPSQIRVTRLTYEEAELHIEEEPLASIARKMKIVRQRRRSQGAVVIDFPEVKIHVVDGQVLLHPLGTLRSREMVEEAMILAGTETARFAAEHGLLMPFSQQEPAETDERPEALSGMFAVRRLMKRSHFSVSPGPHSGLGVPAYTQVTSPLRRYLDLVGHQQLRAFIRGEPQLTEMDLNERIGAIESVAGSVHQAELLSEKHWTLVYLIQHPSWQGEGILVDKRGQNGTILIPDLGLETKLHLSREVNLDTRVLIKATGINLAQRDVTFWMIS